MDYVPVQKHVAYGYAPDRNRPTTKESDNYHKIWRIICKEHIEFDEWHRIHNTVLERIYQNSDKVKWYKSF